LALSRARASEDRHAIKRSQLQALGQASGGDRRLVKPLPFVVDPVENPRNVDDGTEFGYKEFD